MKKPRNLLNLLYVTATVVTFIVTQFYGVPVFTGEKPYKIEETALDEGLDFDSRQLQNYEDKFKHEKLLTGDALLAQEKKVKDILLNDDLSEEETVGLTDRIHEPVKNYSFGMCQRLGIARALISKAKVVILDEPFNGIDPEGLVEVRKMLLMLKKEYKCAVLISSHLLSEIENVADRIVFIHNGKIVEDINFAEHDRINHYITTEEVEKAVQVLSAMGIEAKKHADNIVLVSGNETALSNSIQFLNEARIRYSFIQSKRNIEELYMKMVGGNTGE